MKRKKKPQAVKKEPLIRPYVVRRKKIYKGKMAQPGNLWLELTVTVKNEKGEGEARSRMALEIKGKQGQQYENIMVTSMYAKLRKLYFPQDIDAEAEKVNLN